MKFSGSHHDRSPLNSMDCRHFSGAVGFRTFSFQVGLEKPQEEDPAARPFSGPNNWPNEVPELRGGVSKKNSVGKSRWFGLKVWNFGSVDKMRCIVLGGGNSKICYVHPDPWGRFPIWLMFFNGVVQPPTSYVYIKISMIIFGSTSAPSNSGKFKRFIGIPYEKIQSCSCCLILRAV